MRLHLLIRLQYQRTKKLEKNGRCNNSHYQTSMNSKTQCDFPEMIGVLMNEEYEGNMYALARYFPLNQRIEPRSF